MDVISVLLAFVVWAFIHSILADDRVKTELTRRFGGSSMARYRLVYSVLATASLLPVAWFWYAAPATTVYSVPFPAAIPLYALQLAGALGLVWAVLITRPVEFIGLAEPGDGELVETGLYRWIRHPMYSFGMVAIWASPHMTNVNLALFSAMTLYFIFGSMHEERLLLREYGQDYVSYRQRTGRFLPRLGRKS